MKRLYSLGSLLIALTGCTTTSMSGRGAGASASTISLDGSGGGQVHSTTRDACDDECRRRRQLELERLSGIGVRRKSALVDDEGPAALTIAE